jgi:hypothetical protein
MKRRGERGQPCFTPFLMLMEAQGAMLGETQTSVSKF